MEIIGEGLRGAFDTSRLPAFKPRFPWLGGDLQTLCNSLISSPTSVKPDGRLLAPIDCGAISVAINRNVAASNMSPQIILVHGLGGDENSSYMVSAAAYFLQHGYNVFRMNYRGVGPSAEHSVPPYSAGLTDDLRAVVKTVAAENGGPIILMGFSLGGQLIMRTLGEGNVHSDVCASISVSAPLDLSAAQQQLARRRNTFYSRYVVQNMRRDLEGVRHPAVSVDVGKLSSIWAFDEHVIAPVFGFDGASEYYKQVSCANVLSEVRVPTLAIHAVDDPWIPADAYRQANWPNKMQVGALLMPSGGHVGFHVKGTKTPWHERVAFDFAKHYINV